MSTSAVFERLASCSHKVQAAFYGVVVAGCLAATLLSLFYIIERYDSYGQSLSRVERLKRPNPSSGQGGEGSWGPLLLEGDTATVATAALLRRVTGAVTAAGGTISSSEVEQAGARPRDGSMKVVANFELPHEALPRLLHDLEAGVPFLFIEQLVVQTPANPSEADRLRVRLAVSGLWPGGRS